MASGADPVPFSVRGVNPVSAAGSALAAAKTAAAGFTLTDTLMLVSVIAVIVVVVLVALTWKSRPGRTLSLRSRRQAKIQRAAAEDVAALQQNDRFISPDSPGLHEDDL